MIIALCRILHFFLGRAKQPRVISEIIAGILLGPTVFGHIPQFNYIIFPKESLQFLELIANLGLVLFLFIVGLEVDIRMMIRNARISLGVALFGMAIPFGLGVAVAKGLWKHFDYTENFSFKLYALFIGVALSITTFPVLCRILSELGLLNTNVGMIVLSAGVCNDIVGWVLLALTVAIINSSSGIVALYIVLLGVFWEFFLAFPIRYIFYWFIKRSRLGIEKGPSETMMSVIILSVLISAFFTDAIGVNSFIFILKY